MNKEDKQTPTGTLYGLGVGPGDPELIPLKTTRILQSVDLVFTASSSQNDHSLAVSIAKPYIPNKVSIRLLSFPMSSDKSLKGKAWEEHAQTIVRELEEGHDVAFLTLGDPLTYSTYGYIVKKVQEIAPDLKVETVPGITSYQAAAAVTNTPLVEGEENLLLLSGVKGGQKIRTLSQSVDNIVFLKAYKQIDDIAQALEESDPLFTCKAIVRCGFPDQEIITDIKELSQKKPKYWTLIIAKRK